MARLNMTPYRPMVSPSAFFERDAGIGSHRSASQHGGVGKQLAGAITEPGFTLLCMAIRPGGRRGEAVGVDVEGGGIGGMHGKEQTRLILARTPGRSQPPPRWRFLPQKASKYPLTTEMRPGWR